MADDAAASPAPAPGDAPAELPFAVDTKVTLRPGLRPDACLDSPGEIGKVVEVNAKKVWLDPAGRKPRRRTPFKVQAFDGKAKWYSEDELAAFTGANPSKVVLMQAALRGDLELIGKCVFAGTEITTKDAVGATAVHYAARGGHLQALEQLLAGGCDVNAQNNAKQTPLFQAKDTETINLLLNAGADPTIRDSRGATAADVLRSVAEEDKPGRKAKKKAPKKRVKPARGLSRPNPAASVRASMSGVSGLSVRTTARSSSSSGQGRGNAMVRHSWAGDRMPQPQPSADVGPSSLLELDRGVIREMELCAARFSRSDSSRAKT